MKIISLQGQENLVSYSAAWAFQKDLVEKRIHDEIEDTILICEHMPTVTRGRGLQFSSEKGKREPMTLGPLPEGTEYFEVERGGDLTWHGPGQLTIYPIMKLGGSPITAAFFSHQDIHAYLRWLEGLVVTWLEKFYGVSAYSKKDATGVWVSDGRSEDRKIASIGIAIRKWVTYHGIGINIVNPPSVFQGFSPCGFNPEVMTSLSEILKARGLPELGPTWRARVENEIFQPAKCDWPEQFRVG